MAALTPDAARPAAPLRRLPGASPGVWRQDGTRARLWLDDTQLVQELVRGYTAEYQRFALADLHAVQIRRTPRGMIYNAVLLALLVPMGLELTTLVDERGSPGRGGHVFFWSVLGFFAALLLVNLLRGPTCRTTVVTALGPQALPSLSRVRTARRALARLAARVAAVQGALPPGEAAQAVDRALARVPAGPAAAAAFRGHHR